MKLKNRNLYAGKKMDKHMFFATSNRVCAFLSSIASRNKSLNTSSENLCMRVCVCVYLLQFMTTPANECLCITDIYTYFSL